MRLKGTARLVHDDRLQRLLQGGMDRQLAARLRRSEPEQGPADALVLRIDHPVFSEKIAFGEAVLLVLMLVDCVDYRTLGNLIAVENDAAFDGAPFRVAVVIIGFGRVII